MRNAVLFVIGVATGIAVTILFRWLKPRFERKDGTIVFRYRKSTPKGGDNKKKAGKK